VPYSRRPTRREQQERSQHHEQQKHRNHGNLHLEVQQRGAAKEDAIGDQAGEQDAMRQQKGRERNHGLREEPEAADAVRMRGDQP
jgi:hypothetical protein